MHTRSSPTHVPLRLVLAALLTLALPAALAGPADAKPVRGVDTHTNIAYTEPVPADTSGNLLDLHVPDVAGDSTLPLLIWTSGSAWFSDQGKSVPGYVLDHFTEAGYAVAGVSIRSSSQVQFPGQLYDIRAAIRWLRENADEYGIDPDRFAIMGNSSGGWTTAIAATTGDTMVLAGETGVDGTSSAVQVAVPFFPPTDFLSMDAFAEANDLPQGFAYPHDAPSSPESLLVGCAIQTCPEATEAADPSSYVDGAEVPIWVMHGLEDVLLPFNQSELLYEATTDQGNEARFTLVPSAGHSVPDIIDAGVATTTSTNRGGKERVVEGSGPSWDEVEHFIHVNLSRGR